MNALDDFIRDFAGYGHLGAPLWFVGMEEGGGRDVAELQRRVEAWNARGRRPLEDLAEFHHAIGESKYFRPPYPLQRTWSSLARTLQRWRGAAVDIPTLQQVQAGVLGSHNGLASLIELLPLPSPDTQAWPYAALVDTHPSLVDRKRYKASCLNARIDMLRGLVRRAEPRAVVFYGLAYREHWSEVSHQALSSMEIAGHKCYVGSKRLPYFIAVPHPAARGMTRHFWEAIGLHLGAITGVPSEVT